jgi:putative nucleotidyltransferase with HDIG domain
LAAKNVSLLPKSLEQRSVAYTAALAVGATLMASALVLDGHGVEGLPVVLILAAIAAGAERWSVALSARSEQSISLLPMLFAAVLFGPVASMLVGAASMLGDIRTPYARTVFYTSSRAITGGVAGIVAGAVIHQWGGSFPATVIATVLGALTSEVLDLAFFTIAMRLRRNETDASIIWRLVPIVGISVALYSPLVALLAFTYREVSPWTLPLFLAPALAAQRLWALYQEQRRLTEDLSTANARLERANLSFASALVATLDARDRYTAGHSAAVAIYARDIAARMGLSEDEQRKAHLCGLVHDIGKIGLAPGLLEKPGALTLDERRQMEQHTVIGERILAKVDDYAEIASLVRHHHERVDGNGYPDGLLGDEIPLLSRIIAVADAYNAMTSDRPYRDAMPSRVARLRLAQAVESQFDTAVVAAFEAILAGAPDSYRLGERADFAFEAHDAESASLAEAV